MPIRSLTNEDAYYDTIFYYPCMRHFDPQHDDTRLFRIIIIIINVGRQGVDYFL